MRKKVKNLLSMMLAFAVAFTYMPLMSAQEAFAAEGDKWVSVSLTEAGDLTQEDFVLVTDYEATNDGYVYFSSGWGMTLDTLKEMSNGVITETSTTPGASDVVTFVKSGEGYKIYNKGLEKYAAAEAGMVALADSADDALVFTAEEKAGEIALKSAQGYLLWDEFNEEFTLSPDESTTFALYHPEPAAEPVEMKSASIGGINYYYANTAGKAENTVYVATARSRAGTTTHEFSKSELTQVGETDYYYAVLPNVTPLSGTLYGYGSDGTATNYRNVYKELGVDTDDTYDAITSATKFTGHHAKDIPSLVTYGEVDGEKAITGMTLGRSSVTVDAEDYVEACILKAAGEELTEAQAAMTEVPLKANPMDAPAENTVKPVVSSAVWAEPTGKAYGIGEFDIVPDDTVEGYVWSEYWTNVYAATVSDGKTTVGAVHWIDLYGESATAGPHYNKIQLALNNGTTPASNAAEVSRYAAFFDSNNELKAGTYTITVYAEGYEPLTAVVEKEMSEKQKEAKEAEDKAAADKAAADKKAAEEKAAAEKKAAEIAANNGIVDNSMPKVKIKKASKAKKSFTAKWKKLSKKQLKAVKGIEIEYSLDRNFTESAKFKTVGKKKASVKIKKLKAKKTYYVRAHTYKVVNGVKYVSPWSSVKKVK